MDIANLGASFPAIQAHLQLFTFLLLALPATSFITIKFWLVSRSMSKVQRKTEWVVPPSEDSQEMNAFFDHESSPRANVNHRLLHHQKAVTTKSPNLKRIA
jgi:hypothetical protein